MVVGPGPGESSASGVEYSRDQNGVTTNYGFDVQLPNRGRILRSLGTGKLSTRILTSTERIYQQELDDT